MTGLSLPLQFHGGFTLPDARHAAYLQSVGGGHPVHSSRELALRAGFAEVPLAGIHVLGAAIAAFTAQFAANPVQLLKVESKFLRPAYPGESFELALERLDSEAAAGTPFVAGRYQGYCSNAQGHKVLMLDFKIRVAPAQDRAA